MSNKPHWMKETIPQLCHTRLRNAMCDADITVTELSGRTGIAKSSISHYTHGRVQPSPAYLQRLADALNVTVDYLTAADDNSEEVIGNFKENNMPVTMAARLMNKSKDFIYIGLQQGIFPFGYALKLKGQWSYYISPVKFTEYTGIKVPGQDSTSA